MDEDTTTVSDTIDLGDVDTSQPNTDAIVADETAAQSPEPTTTEATETPEAPAADDNAEWLQNKGIDPTDPNAIAKMAEMVRNAEKRMHEATAKQSKLNEALAQPIAPQDQLIESTDPVVSTLQARIDAIELERNVTNFFNGDGNAELAAERKALEPSMTQVIVDNPAIGQMVKNGLMTYDQLAALAKGSDPAYGTKLKQDGGREALEQVATRQQARAVSGVATTSAVSGDTPSDPFLDGFNSI